MAGGQTFPSSIGSGCTLRSRFEQRRIRSEGFQDAMVFDSNSPEENAVVFDVSTLEAIHAASAASQTIPWRVWAPPRSRSKKKLARASDILTVDPRGEIARLLGSSSSSHPDKMHAFRR